MSGQGPTHEEIVDAALRRLPPRRAPATLEARVSLALQRYPTHPGHTGFRSWPFFARGAFSAACCIIVAMTAHVGPWAFAASLWHVIGVAALSRLQPVIAPAASAYQLATVLGRLVPPDWWYGAAALGGLFYAALFGLGAAAYRTLYFQPYRRGST